MAMIHRIHRPAQFLNLDEDIGPIAGIGMIMAAKSSIIPTKLRNETANSGCDGHSTENTGRCYDVVYFFKNNRLHTPLLAERP